MWQGEDRTGPQEEAGAPRSSASRNVLKQLPLSGLSSAGTRETHPLHTLHPSKQTKPYGSVQLTSYPVQHPAHTHMTQTRGQKLKITNLHSPLFSRNEPLLKVKLFDNPQPDFPQDKWTKGHYRNFCIDQFSKRQDRDTVTSLQWHHSFKCTNL